jgi:hypothetical protein
MNKITRVFFLAVLSVIAAPNATFADNPQRSPSSSSTSGQTGQMYSDQNQNYKQPETIGESLLRRAENFYNRLLEQNRTPEEQEGKMPREGYERNEGYYTNPNQPYQQEAPSQPGMQNQGMRRNENQGMRRNENQGMRRNGGYSNGRGNYMTDNGMPQSYPLSDDTRYGTQNNQPRGNVPRGNGSQTYPNERDEGAQTGSKNEKQYRVYEFMLGKDGKWHDVSEQNYPKESNEERSTKRSSSNYFNGMSNPERQESPERQENMRNEENPYNRSTRQNGQR